MLRLKSDHIKWVITITMAGIKLSGFYYTLFKQLMFLDIGYEIIN
jgi:hypothetical protein